MTGAARSVRALEEAGDAAEDVGHDDAPSRVEVPVPLGRSEVANASV